MLVNADRRQAAPRCGRGVFLAAKAWALAVTKKARHLTHSTFATSRQAIMRR